MKKKLLCITLCVAVILSCALFVSCGEEEVVEKTPTVELMSRTLDANHEFALVGEDDTELLDGKDVTSVSIVYKSGENRYLEIHFTEKGQEKFEDAIDDNEQGLTITFDGEVLASGVLANPDYPERAKLTGKYADIIQLFNKLT